MLDASFVEKIEKLAKQGVAVELIDIENNQTALIVGGDIIHRFTKNEPFGKTEVAEFSSFLDAANRLIEDAELALISVSPEAITLTCDANKPHKFAQVKLPLVATAAYAALVMWEKGPMAVGSIIKLLRTKLHNTYDDRYLSIFRQVEFSRSCSTTVAKVAHRDTMGKTVDNAVKSLAGEIPEVIHFNTPLITNAPTELVRLTYAVDVDHDREAIGITAMGDIVEDSIRKSVLDLVERLKAELPAALVVAS